MLHFIHESLDISHKGDPNWGCHKIDHLNVPLCLHSVSNKKDTEKNEIQTSLAQNAFARLKIRPKRLKEDSNTALKVQKKMNSRQGGMPLSVSCFLLA